MAGELITLPLRLWLRSAQLVTRAAVGATGRAISLAGQAIQTVTPDGSNGAPADAPATPDRPWDVDYDERTEPAVDPRRGPDEAPVVPLEPLVERPPVPREEPAPAAVQTPPADEPAVVSEEPELVREEAEVGAEEGAGADVTVLEPWEGYARMSARDVIARARRASPAELATVRLYESRHRDRQTVLAAVDRQLKTVNGRGQAD